MKRLRNKFSHALLAAIAILASSSFAQAAAVGDNSEVVASFIEHLDSLKQVDQAKKDTIKSAIKELGSDSTDAVTEGLLLIYPDYSAAVESSDNEDVAKAVELLTPLAESDDKFLAADASFYLARTLMNSEQFEEALPRLKNLNRELVDFSAHQGSSQYFVGVAEAGMLKNREAIESFMQFIQFNPDAPERLRVSAWRQVQQLQAIEEGKLSDIHQHMDYSRRHLELADTGDQTQKEQDDIVRMLGVLIKEQEKKECNSSCKKSGSKQDSKEASGQKPSQKPGESKSQKGGSSSNPNGKVVKKNYNDSPASPWSRLRERTRDPANNAFKEKLPANYRDIVEKYFEAANGEGEN